MLEWTPITIEHTEVVGEPTEDRVSLNIHLSATPHPQWASYVEAAPWHVVGQPGSTTERPRVHGRTISVVVTQASMDSAIQQIRSALDGANREYQTRVIDPQVADEAAAAGQAEAAEAKRQELEDRLNPPDPSATEGDAP